MPTQDAVTIVARDFVESILISTRVGIPIAPFVPENSDRTQTF